MNGNSLDYEKGIQVLVPFVQARISFIKTLKISDLFLFSVKLFVYITFTFYVGLKKTYVVLKDVTFKVV